MFEFWSSQSVWSNIGFVLFIINIILAFVIIFLERKSPSATAAWIMLLFALPVFGLLCYVVLSQNIARQKIFKLSPSEYKAITTALKTQMKDMNEGNFDFGDDVSAEDWQDMITMNASYANAYYTNDNDVQILPDGKLMFAQLLKDIGQAKASVNVMYFIIKNDLVGRKLIEALTEKASAGVEVRLLVDAMGSKSINNYLLSDYIKAGGKIAYFFPPKFKYINLKLNYRNHRKIVVIDNETGYIGGFNIAKEYLGMKKKFGYWRDTHIKVKGSSVQDMNARFVLDWRFAAKEEIPLDQIYYSNFVQHGEAGVQIVSSGPDTKKEEVKRAYMKMITSAKDSIRLQSPYFVPDASIQESLKMAAQSGVDVKVMIPCKPDHVFVYWATYASVGDLIRSGIRVYIYDNGFLHSKTLVADGEVASVGSANFDRRSFNLNFEANAFIYDPYVADVLMEEFEKDIEKSHELTIEAYENRSVLIKIKEAVSRLLSDIL